jgi:hypothetical protein
MPLKAAKHATTSGALELGASTGGGEGRHRPSPAPSPPPVLAQHARKAPAPPAPNRHERRAPLDPVAVMAALDAILAAIAALREQIADMQKTWKPE